MGALDWQEAFVAVGAVLGEPLDSSLAAVGGAGAAPLAALVAGLRSTSRAARAEAMARAVTEVAKDLERMRLR